MSVYFIKAVGSNKVKIGFTSRTPKKRLQQIKTGCPEELELVHLIPDGTKEDEKAFHKQFQRSRLHLEWFQYRPEVAEYLGDFSLEETPPVDYSCDVLGLEDEIEISKLALVEKSLAKILSSDRFGMLWYMLRTAELEGPDSVMSFLGMAGSELSLGRPLDDADKEMLAGKRKLRESKRKKT